MRTLDLTARNLAHLESVHTVVLSPGFIRCYYTGHPRIPADISDYADEHDAVRVFDFTRRYVVLERFD